MPNIECVSADAFFAEEDPDSPKPTTWLSPLDISFSQNVIYPCFSDGKGVDKAIVQVKAMECVDVDEFDLTLEPPFPSISAVRWRLKLRDGEGKPLVDENGDVRMGK